MQYKLWLLIDEPVYMYSLSECVVNNRQSCILWKKIKNKKDIQVHSPKALTM